MRTVDLLEAKRDGLDIPPQAIEDFVKGVVAGTVPDYQAAAFLMAVYFRGMTTDELVGYTRAMLHSGEVLSLPALAKRYKVDKHSTGGVGDKVSLTLAPMVAACGPVIPMISGRGLGHTGGTLDKLEAIPGFKVELPSAELEHVVAEAGLAIAGQTANLVPADTILYALRDVTGTVPSVALIAASIMSKKLSVGLDGLVLDVKVGTGAFMKTFDAAQELAQTMIAIGKGMGCDTRACITDMNQPLGRFVGHSNEVAEAIATLRGEGPEDYTELCYALGVEMLGLAQGLSAEAARQALDKAVNSGAALDHFGRMVAAQGGDRRVVDDLSLMPWAPERRDILAPTAGYISAFSCADVGRACGVLGGGRATADDLIDHGVGIEVLHKIGAAVTEKTPLFTITYRDAARADQAAAILRQACTIAPDPVQAPPLVHARF